MSNIKKEEMVCIMCPLGCRLEVKIENGNVIDVRGNRCPKGEIYVNEEITAPKRILPTSIKVLNGEYPLVSVKTDKPISKKLIFDAMEIIKKKVVEAPVKIGDILIENILDSGVNIVATKNVEKNKE